MYERILVPVDGSEISNRGLQEAIKLSKVLGAHLMIRTHDSPLKQAPYALYSVRVYVATYPFFGAMVDCLMRCVGVRNSDIRGILVGRQDHLTAGIGRGGTLELDHHRNADFITGRKDAQETMAFELLRIRAAVLVDLDDEAVVLAQFNAFEQAPPYGTEVDLETGAAVGNRCDGARADRIARR